MSVASPPVQKLLTPPAAWPPTLVVVIDTEEAFDWTAPFKPANTAVTNTGFQPAQSIFDSNELVATYAIDYPVATTPAAVAVLRTFAAEGRCEIGAHPHPWVNPPTESFVDVRHSYPGNLPVAIERRKLTALTEAIAVGFGTRPRVYGRPLRHQGRNAGHPARTGLYGGPQRRAAYRLFPGRAGGALHDRRRPLRTATLSALAMHGPRIFRCLSGATMRRLRLIGICDWLGLLTRLRLSPEGYSLAELIRQTRAALAAGTGCSC
jgi:hypothetical protein